MTPGQRARLAAIRDDLETIAGEMQAARDTAPTGAKAQWRYPLRCVERASVNLTPICGERS